MGPKLRPLQAATVGHERSFKTSTQLAFTAELLTGRTVRALKAPGPGRPRRLTHET